MRELIRYLLFKNEFDRLHAEIAKLRVAVFDRGVLKRQLEEALEEAYVLRVNNERLTNENRSLAKSDQAVWCLRNLSDMSAVPKTFSDNTLKYLKASLKEGGKYSLFDIVEAVADSKSFKSTSQWLLYWSIANAGRAVLTALKDVGRKEDRLSDIFLDALCAAVTESKRHVRDSRVELEISVTDIYNLCGDVIKEADVGADILLIVCGKGLVPQNGLRIFWLQAKKSADSDYTLRYYRKENKSGSRQYVSLRSMDNCEKGSFALFTLYSAGVPFVPSVPLISVMLASDTAPSGDCVIKVDEEGSRLQELITYLASADDVGFGCFNAAGLVHFLADAADNKALPLRIAYVCSDGLESKKELIRNVERLYKDKIEQMYELKQKSKDQGYDLDL